MAIGFLKANFNFKACALGFSHTTIADLYHKYSIKGNVDDLPRSGRPPEKNEEILKDLQVPYTSTPSLSSVSDLSHTTIQNYANNPCLKFKHFVQKPKLSEFHKKLRKNFCDMNKNDKWIFSGESSFQLFRNTKGLWTFDDQILIEKINSFNVLMIWGAISKNGISLRMANLKIRKNIKKFLKHA